ncbi:alpha/beta fold hydrolase [Pseudonocardia sp. DSM 110487]|uniref:alpha/beta fold hydrolase n=1 Tax=Pseudonocardia sp. DSM 110487 TaxID=2865833 RepID=UPI002106A59C|nr:alpha/beta hydrolase [Pseudonocardia sp. DSM 110487]
MSANGIRLHVAECDGGGPLVVLLHGFPEFWWAWRHQLPALADGGFRVVAADLRGYGESDKPPRGYDLWTLAGDVAGLIRALGEPRAHVVGHGWGGLVAWTVTALHPRLVLSLTALGAPHPLALRSAVVRDPRGQGMATARYAAAFQLPRWPERSFRRDGGARVERILRDWSGSEWDDFAESVGHYRRASQVTGVVHCALEYYRWAARSQLRAEGRRFAAAVARIPTVPVLQVNGAIDPCVLAQTAAASHRWAGSEHRMHVMPATGHFPHEEHPAATTSLLSEALLAS